MWKHRTLLLAGGLLFVGASARGQESAKAIVERAIKAHGGEERLSRHRADKVRLKGTLVLGAREVPFTGETTVQLPAQFKNVMQLTLNDKPTMLVQILNGENAYVT